MLILIIYYCLLYFIDLFLLILHIYEMITIDVAFIIIVIVLFIMSKILSRCLNCSLMLESFRIIIFCSVSMIIHFLSIYASLLILLSLRLLALIYSSVSGVEQLFSFVFDLMAFEYFLMILSFKVYTFSWIYQGSLWQVQWYSFWFRSRHHYPLLHCWRFL